VFYHQSNQVVGCKLTRVSSPSVYQSSLLFQACMVLNHFLNGTVYTCYRVQIKYDVARARAIIGAVWCTGLVGDLWMVCVLYFRSSVALPGPGDDCCRSVCCLGPCAAELACKGACRTSAAVRCPLLEPVGVSLPNCLQQLWPATLWRHSLL
jgi:hypothetical protein